MLIALLLTLVQSLSFAKDSKPDSLSDLPPGINCTPNQSQCCFVKIAVERCKADALDEGKQPEMSLDEERSILGSGAKSASVMNCIRNEKSSGHWQGAKNDCQKHLDSCIDLCGQAHAGSWPADHCKKAIEPIMALIDGAKSESDQALAGSRDVLKAMTGADDAGVTNMLNEAKQKLAGGDQAQASTGTQNQVTNPSTQGPVASPSAPTDQVAGAPVTGGTGTLPPPTRPIAPVVTPPSTSPPRDQIVVQPVTGGTTTGVAQTPIYQITPPSNGRNGSDGIAAGTGNTSTTDRVIAGTLDAQVRATAASNASVLRQYSIEDSGGPVYQPSSVSTTPAVVYATASAPTFDEMSEGHAPARAIASVKEPEVEPQPRKSLFKILSGEYSKFQNK